MPSLLIFREELRLLCLFRFVSILCSFRFRAVTATILSGSLYTPSCTEQSFSRSEVENLCVMFVYRLPPVMPCVR